MEHTEPISLRNPPIPTIPDTNKLGDTWVGMSSVGIRPIDMTEVVAKTIKIAMRIATIVVMMMVDGMARTIGANAISFGRR